MANETNKASKNVLVAIEAVKACKRHQQPPFLWFGLQYANISDTKENIKEWMRGRNRILSSRDLITDYSCVAGYEADFIIYLGSEDVSAYMSRCRGQFVQIE